MDIETVRNGSAAIKTYQVLGERCSGTNFVSALVLANLHLKQENSFGWKHGFPGFVATPSSALAIVMFRDAFSWVRSMYAKPWHSGPTMRKLDFPDFIRSEWRSVVDQGRFFRLAEDDPRVGRPLQFDRHPVSGETFANILHLRNAKNAAFLGFAKRDLNVVLCRYEWVRDNPESFIRTIAATFTVRAKPRITVPTGRFGWNMKYRAARIVVPEVFSVEDKAFIVSELDSNIETRLGYLYS